ncbi:MAG: hypothetical protein D6811_00395 [Alphaproteobacteria bacterium]|nr:MAG: hypothetical protein D6811_00395 [Alphaproteobacteria bacterium]
MPVMFDEATSDCRPDQRDPLALIDADEDVRFLHSLGDTILSDWREKRIWAARGGPVGPGRKPIPARAPINPRTGRLAHVDKPETFGTYDEAVARQAKWPDDEDRQPGVGIVLGPHEGDGLIRAALDLDNVTSWKGEALREIIERFNSHTEMSPSGTGVRVIFTITQETLDALDGQGRTISAGKHVEIALKVKGFVTVTGQPGPKGSAYGVVNTMTTEDVLWLIEDLAPRWKAAQGAADAAEAGDTPERVKDRSGSGCGFPVVGALLREGLDADDVAEVMAAGLDSPEVRKAHPGLWDALDASVQEDAEEACEWWARTDERQRKRCIDKHLREIEARLQNLVETFGDAPEKEDEESGQDGESFLEWMNRNFAWVGGSGQNKIAVLDRRPWLFWNETTFTSFCKSLPKVGKKNAGNWWLEHPKRRTHKRGLGFDPTGEGDPDYLNVWGGWGVEPDPDGDCSMILEYIYNILAEGRQDYGDYIISWLADIVQNVERKPGVALVLRGLQGVGKDTLVQIMKPIIGAQHIVEFAKQEQITARFNANLERALLVHGAEAFYAGSKSTYSTLKALITSDEVLIERKGVDSYMAKSYFRAVFTSNETWVVPVTRDQRRFAVFDVQSTRKDDTEYWEAFYDHIKNGGAAAFLHYLLTWETPEGINLKKPPRTVGLTEQKLLSLQGIERWWREVLFSAEVPGSEGFTDGESPWEASSVRVPCEEVRQSFEAWLRGHRHQGDPLDPREFGKQLSQMCPTMRKVRGGTRKTGRVWQYALPDLDTCRKQFAEFLRVPEEHDIWGSEDDGPDDGDDGDDDREEEG